MVCNVLVSCKANRDRNKLVWKCLKETKSATMNIFRFFFYFLFKSFVKVELSYAFIIDMLV